MPWVNRAATRPLEPPERMISSATTMASTGDPPLPPADSGKPTPSRSAAAAARCSSRGTAPASSHAARFGTISASVKRRAEARNARRSSVSQLLTALLDRWSPAAGRC